VEQRERQASRHLFLRSTAERRAHALLKVTDDFVVMALKISHFICSPLVSLRSGPPCEVSVDGENCAYGQR
jgi:hypothetical protein